MKESHCGTKGIGNDPLTRLGWPCSRLCSRNVHSSSAVVLSRCFRIGSRNTCKVTSSCRYQRPRILLPVIYWEPYSCGELGFDRVRMFFKLHPIPGRVKGKGLLRKWKVIWATTKTKGKERKIRNCQQKLLRYSWSLSEGIVQGVIYLSITYLRMQTLFFMK